MAETQRRRSSRLAGKNVEIIENDSKKVTAVKKSAAKNPKKEPTTNKRSKASAPAAATKSEGEAGELEEGQSFPGGFELINQDDEVVNLSDVISKSHIVIIFAYPRASTPGCTRQAKGFRDLYDDLHGNHKATVFGLSADSPKSQTTFKTKQELPYDLLCDTNRKLIKLLGCKKAPSGIIRSHFIFVDGKLVSKRVKISPEDSFNSALKFVEEL
ncbi:thioredoxin peroxidase [Martiniozyma asiatica (nom. inval.)]|nr:thioredoxin peroxidase [Martiniozyma asiatica]